MEKRTKKILVTALVVIIGVPLTLFLLLCLLLIIYMVSCPPYYFMDTYHVINGSGRDILITPLGGPDGPPIEDIFPTGRYKFRFCTPKKLKGAMILIRDGDSMDVDVYDEHMEITHILVSDKDYSMTGNYDLYFYDPAHHPDGETIPYKSFTIPPFEKMEPAEQKYRMCFVDEEAPCVLWPHEPLDKRK